MEKKINPIDRLVKEKLENLSIPYDAGAWQLMEQKLEEDAMAHTQAGTPAADARNIDEAAFEKLHRYEAPYQEGHWKKMEALIEETFAWPRQVLRYKLTELSLMLLLFLLLWQYAPDGLPTFGSPQALDPPTTTGTTTPTDTQKKSTSPPSLQGSLAQPANPNKEGSEKGAAFFPGESLETNQASASQYSSNNPTTTKRQTPIAASRADERQQETLSPLPNPAQALAAKSYRLPSTRAANSSSPPLRPFGPLNKLAPGPLAYEGYRTFEEPSITRIRNGVTFRVGMFGSGEYNHIIVPQSQEKKLDTRLDRYAIGYGGGLSLGMEFGRWEVETGAIYAARQYPVGLVYVQGSVGAGLKGDLLKASQLNILNMPLHIRYNVLQRGGWRAYALTGASVQVVFLASHYTVEDPNFSYLPPSMPPDPGSPNMDQETAIDRIRQEGLGWFEGGTFEENAYLTGNVGVGLERYISPRWSIFTQPTYQYSLQYFGIGLGANSDRVNSLTFLIGAKVRLK